MPSTPPPPVLGRSGERLSICGVWALSSLSRPIPKGVGWPGLGRREAPARRHCGVALFRARSVGFSPRRTDPCHSRSNSLHARAIVVFHCAKEGTLFRGAKRDNGQWLRRDVAIQAGLHPTVQHRPFTCFAHRCRGFPAVQPRPPIVRTAADFRHPSGRWQGQSFPIGRKCGKRGKLHTRSGQLKPNFRWRFRA